MPPLEISPAMETDTLKKCWKRRRPPTLPRHWEYVSTVVPVGDNAYDLLDLAFAAAPSWFVHDHEVEHVEDGHIAPDPSAVVVAVCEIYGIESPDLMRQITIRHAQSRQVPDWFAYECALLVDGFEFSFMTRDD